MNRDFTLKVYETLLQNILANGYTVQTFEKYLNLPAAKALILRHDVDKRPQRALKLAQLEQEFKVYSTYYFRIVPVSFDTSIIKKIAQMGHEIGYHYEDFSLARGDAERAVELFTQHLKQLRSICPLKTICMHGSPLLPWDNRLIWRKINYREFGLIGEPYLDLDFDEVLYISDTGRTWSGKESTIRDKVKSTLKFPIRSTYDLINHIQQGILPKKIMINVHPQRWSDEPGPWLQELLWQNLKNTIKYFWPR